MPYVKDKNGNWKWQDDVGGSAEDQAQQQYINAGQDFVAGGPAEYKWNGDINYDKLGDAPQVGQTNLSGVTTDPRLLDAQMKALSAMEEQGKTGLSAADELALNQSGKKQASDARSRQMTIEQDLARKGRAGGRLGVTMQQQASQASQEAAANDAAQRNAMAQQGRLQATTGAGNLAGNMSAEEYQRKANAAQAQDTISKFNNQNTMQRQEYNNNLGNKGKEQNWSGQQGIANQNVSADYDHRQATMGVQQGTATYNRDRAVDEYNRAQAIKAAKAKKKSGMMGAVGGVVGGVAGAYFGGPAGATAGASVGSSLGSNMAHGGRVNGPEIYPYDTEENDIVQKNLSPGEIVLPKTVAQDPIASAQYVADVNRQPAISNQALDQLAKTRPELVEKYRAKMATSDQGLKDAQNTQDMGNYANVASDLFTNFANSQKDDVIYKNRTADMGKAPTIKEADRSKYDPSMVNAITGQGVARAKDARSQAENEFNNEEKLTDMGLARADQAKLRDKQTRMEDANSQESIDAREYLKQIAPSTAGMPNFDKLSAAQIEKVSPGLYQAYNAKQTRQDHSADLAAARKSHSADLDAGRIQQANALTETNRHNIATEGNSAAEIAAKNSAVKLPSVEQQKANNNSAMGLKGVRDMRAALTKGDNTFSLFGDNDFTEAQRRSAEAFGRLQSGGAINKDEEERFKDMGPKVGDSKAMQMQKLANQEAEYMARLKEAGIDAERYVQERATGSANSVPSAPKPSWAK